MREHKTALITGASGGLGLEFAKILAKKRYNLVLVARNEGKLYSIKNELESKYGIDVNVCAADLSKVDVFNYTLEHDMNIDVLINNAGFGDLGIGFYKFIGKTFKSIKGTEYLGSSPKIHCRMLYGKAVSLIMLWFIF